MTHSATAKTPLRLGLAGLGTVGMGVVKIIQEKADLLALRAGRPVVISAVAARSKGKDRGYDLSGYGWEDDPVKLAQREDVDIFVELMGGSDGPAKAATEAALALGKDVVTANKALLAHHGQALAELAESNDAVLRFEAAVAGGIPVMKALTEGLAGNGITRVIGVMNGTCNYILTRMEATGQGYNALFDECARLGYLEADPQLDVGGIDAGHKLSLLASVAFGTQVSFGAVELEGIERISNDDIAHAADMGYKIKLLGVTQMSARGLEQRMTPCLVPQTSPLGQLDGGTNMVVLEGDEVGQIVLRGAGAGMGPTASAVMSDIMDIARGTRLTTFGQPAASLIKATPAVAATPASYYLRLALVDKPGSMAKITTALGDSGVSIDRMRQYGQDEDPKIAPVLIVTDPVSREALDSAIAAMETTGVLASPAVAIRIEQL
ncbi:homoserine dehydrogenase [Pacificibacter maritimus]|uniref:Homoserine dehydrogenase n=1 Tax=Pacificibacter maritimus TaxID=762213 RepID=A0A3N4VGD1_9RHOB|nr:homoserine dehydrogenase [Pacificibacter maritimus]RPE72014.1 homoserine dehydrogenase [Pacificibacter maritimus]